MAAVEMFHHQIDIEGEGTHHDDRSSLSGSEASYFSDDDDDGVHSCRSHYYSTTGDDYSLNIVSDHDMALNSRVSDCSIEVVEVEGAGVEIIRGGADLVRGERDCRICHLGYGQESGVPIQLGCSCKDDLAFAHKQCAEVWFRIKGNKTCEVCHSVARNVVGPNDAEFTERASDAGTTGVVVVAASVLPQTETGGFITGGHRILNFLLACVVFAFVLSWLFHFNVPS